MVDKKRPRLPKQQLTILAVCRFAEPVAMTSVYPYIPEMVQSFDVPTDQVAKYAGLMSAVFSLSQAFTGIAWGRASDRFGRKPMILLALSCTMVAGLLFGFSRSLLWAFVARSLQGLSNGNVGIIRTAVAELVTEKELQPRAFSLMPLVWTVGSIFGPAFGGSLVHPVERFPDLFARFDLFKRYPFAFPNVLISTLFLISISCGFLFLRETLEDKRHKRDYGLALGKLLTRSCRKRDRKAWHVDADGDANEPFLAQSASTMSSPTAARRPSFSRPIEKSAGWDQVFTRQSSINLLVYTFLAMHSVAYDQLLPVFMHYPVQSRRDPEVKLPLRFAGGFGIDSSRIGMWFMVYGIYGMCIQFLVFPVMAKRFGVLNCLKLCTVIFPVVYLATPFTALLQTGSAREGGNLVLMLFKGFCAIFSFPCSTILLTNSAASLKVLGTLNGVATSISALGRAAGPAISGWAFTEGVDAGYVLVSWWILALIAIIGAIPVWWLVEMDGFSSAPEEEEDEVDYDESGDMMDGGLDTSGNAVTKDNDSGTNQRYLQDDEGALINEGSPLLLPEDQRSYSDDRRRTSRNSTAVFDEEATENDLRRMPSPIGLGPGIGGRSRRYSSEIGATRSGFGTGGTSYH
ncbi:uncharacterized protein HMPREF1541_07101 [Cyphellophora europaea CBS 101466]|uniref:Major facilitator superfamily (MFS) profile domain-containing protein n=1 Tax=Cyphellophora europaea (strain CBS 101466) TaxID=1220924 RepID=W2RP32_CYPE1|nr:uncharacterized protein HMPREF1541_07101 [Cyphellophora europaea CBS 101466]ETN37479.1 hypothetical protein HMPREF1541_07101 [Cyphellophora europaea CBS 101466]